jgi:hypothetical protein
MKGASNWTITGNTFNKRPVHVTKDSNNNTFTGNTYLVGAFVKIDYCYQVAPSTNCKDPATNPGGTYFTPSNTLFSGETITGNAVAYCLYVSGATGTRFVDSAFANCGKPALQFDDASGGPGITTDVTFISGDPFAVVAPRDVVVSGKVRLAVGWKLDVLVRNEAAAPLEGVRLLAVNSDGSTLFDLTTDAAGEIPQQEVIVRTGVNAVLRTPFTINAMRSGYTTQAVRTSPTANTSLTIDMVRNQ